MVATDEPLVVDAIVIAFRAVVGGGVEHHPGESSPEAGMFLHLPVRLHMVARLVLFGMEARGSARPFRRIRVVVHGGARTVFAHRHRLAPGRGGMAGDFRGMAIGFSARPAGIDVDSQRIGNAVYGHLVDAACGGHHRTGGIEAPQKRPGVAQQLERERLVRAFDVKFVVEAPHHDGRAVAELRMHLPRATEIVLAVDRRRRDEISGGQFAPCQQPLAVAFGIEAGAVRIMGGANTVASHLLHHRHRMAFVFAGNGPTLSFPVLMVIDSTDHALPAVEVEVSVFPEFDCAESERLFDGIGPRPLAHCRAKRVEHGIFRRPELWRRHGESVAFRTDVRSNHLMHDFRIAGAGDERLHRHAAGLRVGGYRDARTAINRRIDAHRASFDKPHLAVESAENRIIGGVRQIVEIVIVVDHDIERVRPVRTHPARQFEAKTGN